MGLVAAPAVAFGARFAAVSRLGALTGASVEGVVLAFGGFSLVGVVYLGAAVVAALVIGAKVRGIGALQAHVAGA